jgi:hypothetical protein
LHRPPFSFSIDFLAVLAQVMIFHGFPQATRSAPAPGMLLRVPSSPRPRRTIRNQAVSTKNERPVGGPAARAWGMEGTVIRSPLGSSGRSAALASSRTTHRSKRSHPLNYSRKPEQLPITCLVSFSPELPSIARRVQFLQYSSSLPMYCYGSTPPAGSIPKSSFRVLRSPLHRACRPLLV